MSFATEAEWEAARKEVESRKAGEPLIDWSSSRLKHNWTEGLESLTWVAADWRKLPSLRKHEHTDGYGGPLQKIDLPRCRHGVYLTNDPLPELDYEDNVIEWKAPYCYCCWPLWLFLKKNGNPLYLDVLLRRFKEEGTDYLFLRRRPLEQGELWRIKDKLLDGRKVYPEVFTKPIRLRGRTLTSDLRLQEDPETGKPRLETMGGYVAKEFGYGRAGRGHGADSEADEIRMSWLAASEDSPVGHADHEEMSSREGWMATLPSVCPPGLLDRQETRLGTIPRFPDWYSFSGWRGITEENWQPSSFPMLRGPAHTNSRSGLGLKESEFFGDERLNSMDPATMRNLISWGKTRRHQQLRVPDLKLDDPWEKALGRGGASSFLEERIHNPKYLLADRRIPDPCRATSFIAFYVPLHRHELERESFQFHYLRWFDGPADCQRPLIHSIEPAPRPEFPDLDNWQSPLEWVIRNGRYQARFTTATMGNLDTKVINLPGIFPTARHFAQWGRKAEYQRGGGIHRVPRRRTPEWSDDWRTERPMRDLAANIKMYRWGVVNSDPEQLPDIPAKVAQRMEDGTTREIQVDTMCATAYENYRLARLALATNHGKVGFWRTERLEGNERGTALDKVPAWGGKAPQIYRHRRELRPTSQAASALGAILAHCFREANLELTMHILFALSGNHAPIVFSRCVQVP